MATIASQATPKYAAIKHLVFKAFDHELDDPAWRVSLDFAILTDTAAAGALVAFFYKIAEVWIVNFCE